MLLIPPVCLEGLVLPTSYMMGWSPNSFPGQLWLRFTRLPPIPSSHVIVTGEAVGTVLFCFWSHFKSLVLCLHHSYTFQQEWRCLKVIYRKQRSTTEFE